MVRPDAARAARKGKEMNQTAAHERSATSVSATAMKAVVQRGYGGAEVLALESIARPVAADGEVLLRVRAASVNHADWVMTSGTPLIARLAFGLRQPKQAVRGKAVAGIVVATGAGVSQLQIGDEVYGELPSGAFAEFVTAPANLLTLKPATLSFEQAAAVPLAAGTALQGLRDAGKLVSGQRVLINGASGGVGTFAVQIAKALGAEVTAVCSTRNADLMGSLGADHVIDYTREDFTADRGRYDLIFDLIGNRSLRECIAALTPKGSLVLSSGTGSRLLGPLGRMLRGVAMAPFVSQRLVSGWTPRPGHDDQLGELLESGAVIPAIDTVYSLDDAAAAIRHFAEVHARGKIVITTATE
jgi:NADPH:quinone reductase-like Zn-dependent oxidoreductase